MAYRAIDDKIDLVRFIQAYESVLAAFGVDENPMTESEKESLKVAERIVFRLFCMYSVRMRKTRQKWDMKLLKAES